VVQLPNRLLLSNTVFDRGSRINGPKETRSAEVDQRLLACRSRSGIFCVAGTAVRVLTPKVGLACLLTQCHFVLGLSGTVSKIFSSFQACKGLSAKNFIWHNIYQATSSCGPAWLASGHKQSYYQKQRQEKVFLPGHPQAWLKVTLDTEDPSYPCNIQSSESRIACIHGRQDKQSTFQGVTIV
jgi:hypothetical protein